MTAAFWVVAPIVTLAALGVLFVRKAVHAALLLAVVMIGLAVLYAALGAPFLFAVQIVVYTGAILMLFLFVLMLVGVDASDSLVETIPGQRWLAWGAGLVLGVLLVLALGQLSLGAVTGFGDAAQTGNVPGLANLLFSRYVVAFEVTSALLITAALGAMVLAHRERLEKRPGQADLAARRVRDYAEKGTHLGPLPAPGVYARHNAVDTPALLPDGTPAESSVPAVLAARGTVRTAPAADLQRVRQTSYGVAGGATDDKTAGSGVTTERLADRPDGTVRDGSVVEPEGSVVEPKGSVVEPGGDGSVVEPEGSVVEPEGSVVEPGERQRARVETSDEHTTDTTDPTDKEH